MNSGTGRCLPPAALAHWHQAHLLLFFKAGAALWAQDLRTSCVVDALTEQCKEGGGMRVARVRDRGRWSNVGDSRRAQKPTTKQHQTTEKRVGR